MENKFIATNIQDYEVRDVDCELLIFKASACNINKLILGPSSLKSIDKVLKKSDVKIGVSISYPSGAYFTDAKVGEIANVFEEYDNISAFYVVLALGRYLSGYKKETLEEMNKVVDAAKGVDVYFFVEACVLSSNQKEELCKMAEDAGVKGIVCSTGFLPYDVPMPKAQDVKDFVKVANGKIQIIAAGQINDKTIAEEMLNTGADFVLLNSIDFL